MKTRSGETLKSAPGKSVWGVASSRIQASRIVDHLANAGFDRDAIFVLFPGGNDTGSHARSNRKRAPAGTGIAVQIGLAVGGALGWLAGLDAFSVPGFGHLAASGPAAAVLLGAGADPAVAHGVKRALLGIGIHRNKAELYQTRVTEGQILICLQTDDWREASAARTVFQALGATNITISGPKASDLLNPALARAAGGDHVSGQTPECATRAGRRAQ